MKQYGTKQLTLAAMVAALYAVLSYFGGIFNLTYGPIQFRFSEVLCVLPFLFPTTAPGLFVGCLIANLLSPYGPLDIIFGSLATLLAALLTVKMPNRWLAPLPPVLCNAFIVGAVLSWSEINHFGPAFWSAFAFNSVTVGLGELGACYGLGLCLLTVLPKISYFQPMIAPARLSK